MLKQLQFKYPTFPSRMSNLQAQEITQKYCHVSLDYSEELEKISKPESRQDDIVIQFPYTPVVIIHIIVYNYKFYNYEFYDYEFYSY